MVDISDQRQLVTALGWVRNDDMGEFLVENLSKKLGGLMGILYRKMDRLFSQKRQGEGGKYFSTLNPINAMKDPDQEKYTTYKEEDLTHDYLIGLFSQIINKT